MSAANWGAGISGFSSGINQGLQLGGQIQDAKQKKEIRKARESGMADAQAGYETEVKNSLGEATIDPNTGKKTYMIDGIEYGEEAAMETVKQSGKLASVEDRFFSQAVPKIKDIYVKHGDMEKAAAWEEFADKRATKKAFSEWSAANNAMRKGDIEALGEYVVSQYNSNYEDGFTVTKHDPIKGDDGTVTGYNITLKQGDGDDAKTVTQTIDRDAMLEYGMMALSRGNPQAMFEMDYQANQRDLTSRAASAAADNRQQKGFQHDEKMKRLDHELKNDPAELDKKLINYTTALRGAGFSDDEIKAYVPSIMGLSSGRKGMSDQDMRVHAMKIVSDANKDAIKPKSPEELEKDAERMYQIFAQGFGGNTVRSGGLPSN